ncbi:DUF4397 domain-containing protein [Chitinophaga sp. GCM10012297]|uniref:DUF4397 domain-containing protein n=1 Tax=Chitinophaga chungangae TaxID=2821488 RepID=A0ABS3Y9S4_9BACT|nr:DUF4397 domain-containing protein [Chitinophaga chungangae]MBO9151427.1 DUF4397 domain-containing protein [Chitinophaga chungangae]
MVTKKSRLWALAAVAVAITGFSSCLKNSDPTPPEPQTLIAFVNGVASPTYGLDIFQEGQKITPTPIAFGEAVGARFKPDRYKFDFKKGGVDSLLNTLTATYDTSAYNTVVVYGEQSTGIEVHRILENFENISRTKTNVRFYNLMSGPDGVDVFIGANKIFASRYYADFVGGGYSQFEAVDAGNTTVTVKDAAGTQIATKGDAALTAVGGAYNIYLMGQKDSTGVTKPVIKVITYQ